MAYVSICFVQPFFHFILLFPFFNNILPHAHRSYQERVVVFLAYMVIYETYIHIYRQVDVSKVCRNLTYVKCTKKLQNVENFFIHSFTFYYDGLKVL
jgi:hypothetical protein